MKSMRFVNLILLNDTTRAIGVRRELSSFNRQINQKNSEDSLSRKNDALKKNIGRKFNSTVIVSESKFGSIPPITRSSTLHTPQRSGKMGSNDEKKSMKLTGKEFIIWVDCEMSGLDVEKEVILEIAVIITDAQLKEVARHEEIIINATDTILNSMDAWCLKHHGDSGLTEASRNSKITLKDADDILSEFAAKHTEPGICPLAGNSIFLDRVFIAKYLPKFSSHLHYRNIDVSTIKELSRRWFPKEFFQAPKKLFAHRTLSDIEESIEELKYYRTTVFKPSDNEK